MENLIIAALLLPRSTSTTTGAPTVLGKVPEGFAALLQGFGQGSPDQGGVLTGLPSTGSPAPDMPVTAAQGKNTPVTSDEHEKKDEETATEATPETSTVTTIVLLEGAPVLPPSQSATPASAEVTEVAPEQGNVSTPVAFPVQKAPAVAQQLDMDGGLLRADGKAPAVSHPAEEQARPTAPATQQTAAAAGKGIDLALLEEAGMNILRATGEAQIQPPVMRLPADLAARRSTEEARDGRPVVQQAQDAPQKVLAKNPEVAAPLTREIVAPKLGARADDRRAEATSSKPSATPPPESPSYLIRPAESAREISRPSLPETAEADQGRAIPKSTPQLEKTASHSRAEQAPQDRPAAPESPEAPAAQNAQSAERTGADELMGRSEEMPSTRGAVEAGAKQILASRTEGRTPEIARTLVDQVIKALQLEVKGPVSEMRLKLEPESLGELALRVRVEEGKMQARIEVSQPAVKAVIEANLPQLRQALATQGIQMDRIDITTQDRSLSRGSSDGSGGRERRRAQKEGEGAIEESSVQGARMLGYNTIELTM